MVGVTGIEPVTPSMSRKCSSAELRARLICGYEALYCRSLLEPQPQALAGVFVWSYRQFRKILCWPRAGGVARRNIVNHRLEYETSTGS